MITVRVKIAISATRTAAPMLATHLPNLSVMITAPMPAQTKIRPKMYSPASERLKKNRLNVVMAVMASVSWHCSVFLICVKAFLPRERLAVLRFSPGEIFLCMAR